jgi:hypothetical protein
LTRPTFTRALDDGVVALDTGHGCQSVARHLLRRLHLAQRIGKHLQHLQGVSGDRRALRGERTLDCGQCVTLFHQLADQQQPLDVIVAVVAGAANDAGSRNETPTGVRAHIPHGHAHACGQLVHGEVCAA